MASAKSLSTAEGKAEFDAFLSAARASYEAMGISAEIESAVLKHLEDIGALTGCAVQGRCTGGCPSGQSCIRTIRNNCVCSNNFTD
jgi:heterodisulfide reductase subunit C